MKNYALLYCCVLCLLLQRCSKKNESVPTCVNCDFTCIEDGDMADINTNLCKDNWTCTYSVLTNSAVDVDERKGVRDGDLTVFQMNNHTEGDMAIIDDEVTHTLVFEIDSDQESFSADDEDLHIMNVHFQITCYCFVEFVRPTSGCLQGEVQEDGSWFIQGNLFFEEENVKLEAQFD